MIRKNIIGFVLFKLLLCFLTFLAIAPNIEAQQYYNLEKDITHEFPDDYPFPYTKMVCIASKSFSLPPQFLQQTHKMIERESIFRDKIGKDVNVAQLCIYGSYRYSTDWKFVENFGPASSKYCYLSGDTPKLFFQDKKPKSTSKRHVQTITCEEEVIHLVQRSQPLLRSILDTLCFLIDINVFVENLKDMKLPEQAKIKHKQIQKLIESKDKTIGNLHKIIQKMKEHKGCNPLDSSANQFTVGILSELITCLNGDDFAFCGMEDARNNRNLEGLIKSVQKEISKEPFNNVLGSIHI